MDQAARTASLGVGVALGVLGLKLGAWTLTGSVALLADALESVVNVAAALAAFAALRLAARPADANHPYGHAKAEYVSAVLEGALIVVAAFLILAESWAAWRDPRLPAAEPLGLAAALLATSVNAGWAWVLRRRARALRSPALAAESRHLLADVVSTLAVLTGLGVALATGLAWLDPLLAALAAAYILWSGGRLVRESVGGLMDEAVPPELALRIRGVVAATADGALEAHDLRTRHAGRTVFVEFHLVVPGGMRVDAAHAICDRVEEALRTELGHAVVTIHVEPDGKAKHSGVLVL